MSRQSESAAATVSARAKQVAETGGRDGSWVEASVWTERMLAALGNGVQGQAVVFFATPGLFTRIAVQAQASQSRWRNHRLESRMRENRTYGSEGGEVARPSLPL